MGEKPVFKEGAQVYAELLLLLLLLFALLGSLCRMGC